MFFFVFFLNDKNSLSDNFKNKFIFIILTEYIYILYI
jgi:hypothetical protein